MLNMSLIYILIIVVVMIFFVLLIANTCRKPTQIWSPPEHFNQYQQELKQNKLDEYDLSDNYQTFCDRMVSHWFFIRIY